jgi:AcrR family transcriptional regulator
VTQAAEATGHAGADDLARAAPPAAVPPSRRDRLRAATIEEIIGTARRLLVRSGPEAVSLRAIAREMGMTAPGLYRYFGSHEELIRHVIAGIFTELGEDIHRAIHTAVSPDGEAVSPDGDSPDGDSPDGDSPDGDSPALATVALTLKMVAACREFRRWALNHEAEFALLFGVPLPGIDDKRHDIADDCAMAFAGTFFTLFFELWQRAPFTVAVPQEIDAGLLAQLTRYRDALGVGTDLPVGAVLTFLRCWTLLYGAVSMEVFGHMSFALTDPAPMFEITLGDLAALVGLQYPLPG